MVMCEKRLALREVLENPSHPRKNTRVIAGTALVHGQQAARLALRAEGSAYGDYEQSTAKKRTRRERFLCEMENVVPYKALIDLIEFHYPKTSSTGGRPPYRLASMLRIYLQQQWYDHIEATYIAAPSSPLRGRSPSAPEAIEREEGEGYGNAPDLQGKAV